MGPEKVVILGPEYDDALRLALRETLISLGGTGLSHDWGIGGSQEVETTEIQVGAELIVVEAETFVGLSVRGPIRLVEQIREMVRMRVSR